MALYLYFDRSNIYTHTYAYIHIHTHTYALVHMYTVRRGIKRKGRRGGTETRKVSRGTTNTYIGAGTDGS